MLRIQLIWCGFDFKSWICTEKNRSGSDHGSSSIVKLFFFFSLIFMLKLNEPFRYQEIFMISIFLQFRFGVWECKRFLSIFGWYFYPRIQSVDLHIFAGLDLGSQNLADPTDLNPKHCYIKKISVSNCIYLYYIL